MAEGKRQLGTVRWFSAQKGFGFITINSTGEDLFVHHTAILSRGFRTLNEGDAVEFSVDIGHDNRARAADVFLLPKKVHSTGNMPAQKSKGGDGHSTLPMAPESCDTGNKISHVATNFTSREEDNAVGFSAENGLENGARTAENGHENRAKTAENGHENRARTAQNGHDINRARAAANVHIVSKPIISGSARNTPTQIKRGGDAYDSRRRIAPNEPCYTCGKMGHFAADCRSSGGNYGAYMRSESCYNCGRFGHFARDCCIVMRKKEKIDSVVLTSEK